ncbi:hypothetical protein PEB0150_019880 [Bartonella apis]|nr:hypothetical protein PEB0150_019880 [Bartonella apis]
MRGQRKYALSRSNFLFMQKLSFYAIGGHGVGDQFDDYGLGGQFD